MSYKVLWIVILILFFVCLFLLWRMIDGQVTIDHKNQELRNLKSEVNAFALVCNSVAKDEGIDSILQGLQEKGIFYKIDGSKVSFQGGFIELEEGVVVGVRQGFAPDSD